jgi:hypothetical protein
MPLSTTFVTCPARAAIGPFGIALVLLVPLTGCAEADAMRRVGMYGQVTLNGAPLNDGSISLLPAADNKAPTANAMIKQGVYLFDRANGPVAGAYRVLVMQTTGDATVDKMAGFRSGPPPPKREWESKVEVPVGSEFEHNIELK